MNTLQYAVFYLNTPCGVKEQGLNYNNIVSTFFIKHSVMSAICGMSQCDRYTRKTLKSADVNK